MKKLMLNLSLAFAASALFVAAGCSKDDDEPSDSGPGNALVVAKADSDLSVFVEAIEKADLSGSLTGGGEVTVFAPTDAVFSAFLADLGANDIDGLIAIRGKAAVQQILRYHLLEGKSEASAITKGYAKTMAKNSEGDAMDLYLNNTGSVTINGTQGAIVTSGDIEASNGIIHKINKVLTPRTISGLLASNSDFSILLEASAAAAGDVVATLNDANSKFTLMAPNNTAFNSFFGGSVDIDNVTDMVAAFGTQGLQDLLDYHILLGYIRTDDLSDGDYPTRLNGESQSISRVGTNIIITDGQGNQANLVFTNITAINGNINIITAVLQDD